MGDFKGCAKYTHIELDSYAKRIKAIRADYDFFCTESEKYQEVTWKGYSKLKRFWLHLKAGIFTPDEYWEIYFIKEAELNVHYVGTGLLTNIAKNPYINSYWTATDIISLADSNKDCYLGVDQIKVINRLNKHYHKVAKLHK